MTIEEMRSGARGFVECTLDRRALDEESRSVDLAFSSDAPIERFFGFEVLSHDAGSVRMGRMNDGAAVLMNHDPDHLIGVVESARIDADGRGRARVRFGQHAEGERALSMVRDDVLRHVSVGYLIHDFEESRADGVPTFRVTDWEPLEVSMVSVPADAGVGIGRSITSSEEDTKVPKETTVVDGDETRTAGDGGAEVTEEQLRQTAAEDKARAAREKEDGEIRALATQYSEYGLSERAEELIKLGGSAGEMRAAIRNAIVNKQHAPMPQRHIPISGGAPRYKRLKAFRELGEEAAYRSGMWARATLFGDQECARWCAENGIRVQTGEVLTKGGAIVPEEMSQAIIDLREVYGVIRSLARVVPMQSDTLIVPRRTGGVTAYFVGQEEATTASDKAWDQVQLVAKELSALTRFSMAYAEDAIIDVGEDLADEMAYAFSEKEDDCAINGDGTSTYGGIVGFRAKLLEATSAGSVVTADSGVDTYAEMDAADLANIRGKLPEYAAVGAVWLTSKPGKNVVIDEILRAAGGATMMETAAGPRPQYLGDEVRVSQKMPTSTGDLSDVIMMLYGDFMKACTLGDRAGFSVQVLRERYAEFRQIGVIATERFDFVAHDTGTATEAGPVVGFKGN